MSVFLFLIGIIIACLNTVAYLYLFIEAIINFNDIRENIKLETYRLPIMGVRADIGTYLVLSFVMSHVSVLLVYGMFKKRTVFMWPWILAAFHILANYSYFMLFLLTEMIANGQSLKENYKLVIPGLILVGQIVCYVLIFIIFKRLFIENITRRYEMTRW